MLGCSHCKDDFDINSSSKMDITAPNQKVNIKIDNDLTLVLATILSCSRYKDDFDIKPSSQWDITAPN